MKMSELWSNEPPESIYADEADYRQRLVEAGWNWQSVEDRIRAWRMTQEREWLEARGLYKFNPHGLADRLKAARERLGRVA